MKQIPQINIVRSEGSINIYYYLPEKIMGPSSGGKNLNEAKIKILKNLEGCSHKKIYLKSTLESDGITKEALEKYNGYSVLKKDNVGIARNIDGHWRLIGFGEVIE